MLDENGSTVDIFPIFSTLDEEKTEHPINDNGNSSPRVIGDVERTETLSDSLANSGDKFTTDTVEIDLKRSESSLIPFIIGGLAIIGVGTGIVLYKKKK